jgi:Phage integrase, N-terminal SAM-like domain
MPDPVDVHRGPASPGLLPTTRPRLLDSVREALRTRHYSRRTEKAYIGWIKRYIFFHGKRHPDVMGSTEIGRFLTSLAVRDKVSASTQNQAFSALLFLYRLCAATHKRNYVAAPAMWHSGWSLLSVAGE